MVAMKSYTASGSCTAQVLATLAQTLAEAQPFTADFLCVFYDALHDDQAITLSSTSISRVWPGLVAPPAPG